MDNTMIQTIRQALAAPSFERSPCGHDSDVLRLGSTAGPLLYCQRCERGFDSMILIPA